MGKNLDERDFLLLGALAGDSSLSEKKLSRLTCIPLATVHNRLAKLKELGVILGYGLRIDYKKIGKNITAYVLVKATGSADQNELLNLIITLPGVYEAAMVTGEFDIIFKARAVSMEELNSLVVRRLRKFKSISETRTMISYETIENQIV